MDFISLIDRIRRLESDDEARVLMDEVRWANGFVCPQCQCTEGTRLKNSLLTQCSSCRKQTSPTANTSFHRTKRLKCLLQIIGKICDGVLGSTTDIAAEFHLPYKTAWHLTQKARMLVAEIALNEQLDLIDCCELKPALYKRSSESTTELARSFIPITTENLHATVCQAITFFLLVFFGISRKYCQLYLTQFTLLVRREGLEIGRVLEACCRGSPLTRLEVRQYHSPPAVLIGQLSIQT